MEQEEKTKLFDNKEKPEKEEKRKEEISEIGIQILINDYNLCTERINSFLSRQDSILQVSLALVGGAIAFTLLNPIADELYFIIPLIPILIFIHILYRYMIVIVNLGYRVYLQEKLNDYLPKDRGIKYADVVKEFTLNKNPISQINAVLFPSIILMSMIYATIMSNFNIYVIVINLLVLGIISIVGYKLFYFTIDLNEKVKNFCA